MDTLNHRYLKPPCSLPADPHAGSLQGLRRGADAPSRQAQLALRPRLRGGLRGRRRGRRNMPRGRPTALFFC